MFVVRHSYGVSDMSTGSSCQRFHSRCELLGSQKQRPLPCVSWICGRHLVSLDFRTQAALCPWSLQTLLRVVWIYVHHLVSSECVYTTSCRLNLRTPPRVVWICVHHLVSWIVYTTSCLEMCTPPRVVWIVYLTSCRLNLYTPPRVALIRVYKLVS